MKLLLEKSQNTVDQKHRDITGNKEKIIFFIK